MAIGDSMRKKLEGTNRRLQDAMLDELTGLLPTMSVLQHEVHKGNVWAFSHRVMGIGLDEYVYVQIDTGERAVSLYLVKFWGNTAMAEIDLLRAPDLTPGTAPIPFFRLNHTIEKPPPAGFKLFSNPSGISGGDVCQCNFFGSGDVLGVGSRSDSGQRGMPLIMAPLSTYIISVKNLENAARAFAIQGFFSVEQDG